MPENPRLKFKHKKNNWSLFETNAIIVAGSTTTGSRSSSLHDFELLSPLVTFATGPGNNCSHAPRPGKRVWTSICRIVSKCLRFHALSGLLALKQYLAFLLFFMFVCVHPLRNGFLSAHWEMPQHTQPQRAGPADFEVSPKAFKGFSSVEHVQQL